MRAALRFISFGAGQDSATMLNKMIRDAAWRAKFQAERLIVIMSDTGDEHVETYRYVAEARKICDRAGIEFFFLTSNMGYHTEAWQDLIQAQMRAIQKGHPMIVQLNTKSCTDHLKIVPIYKFLDAYINKTYGYGFKVEASGGCDKKAIKRFAREQGKIHVMIGFAAGEEKRRDKSKKLEAAQQAMEGESWKKAIVREYPLIDFGMDRQACQDYLRSIQAVVPPPSNCMRCPYMSKQEMVWLHRFHPDKFAEWVEIEAAKIAFQAANPVITKKELVKASAEGRDPKIAPNNGVLCSKKLLPQVLEEALALYGSWTDAQLNDYKFSHGHCTNAAY